MATYQQIKEANDSILTTDIKGKEYAMVNQRIKAFRMVYPDGFILTDMISNDGEVCVFRANVGIYENGEPLTLGTGSAFEKASSSFINKTSYIENCETSAVGRALGMAGFGIDTSVASYEEVQNAINNQGKKPKKEEEIEFPEATALVNEKNVTALFKSAEAHKVPMEKILENYGVSNAGELTLEQWTNAMRRLEATK